jgi:hypothetical protein
MPEPCSSAHLKAADLTLASKETEHSPFVGLALSLRHNLRRGRETSGPPAPAGLNTASAAVGGTVQVSQEWNECQRAYWNG